MNGLRYFEIADNSSAFLSVSILLIIIGVFVAIIGIVGTIGAILASTVFGRILLGLYAIVLGLLVVCEIAGGIAAAVRQNDLENFFRASANSTFQQYGGSDRSINHTWDTFQQAFKCCGVESWTDYSPILGLGVVPASCCNTNTTYSSTECEQDRRHVTTELVSQGRIFSEGCVEAVISDLRNNLGVITGGAIAIGVLQIFGIVLACFVAIYKHRENKYEVV